MGNTYEYTGINESVTISLPASADMGEEMNGKAVKLVADGIALPVAGETCMGIVLLTEDERYKKGDDVTVQIKDIGIWKAGAEIAMGDALAADAEGLCQKATAGQYVLARALNPAIAKGDLIRVQIIHAGILPAGN